jgi:putative transcriptional regulator
MFMHSRNFTGHILVAPPKTVDKRFSNTVIYIVNHTQSGAWGLVLNKPGNLSNKELMRQIGIDAELVGIAHSGGPMNLNSVHFLHSADVCSSGTFPGPIHASGDMEFIEKLRLGQHPAQYRLFVGSCSWAPGQLEQEVFGENPFRPEHSWLTVPATPELVFNSDDMAQWQQSVNECAATAVKDWMC